MIIEPFQIYEGIIGAGTFAALIFILHSKRIIVIHRRFLLSLAIGVGIMSIGLIALSKQWPKIGQITHLAYIFFLTVGLYTLTKETRSKTSNSDMK